MFMDSKNQHVYPTRSIHLLFKNCHYLVKNSHFLFIQNNEKQQNDTSLKTSTSLEQQGNYYPKNSSFFEKNPKPSLVTKNLT